MLNTYTESPAQSVCDFVTLVLRDYDTADVNLHQLETCVMQQAKSADTVANLLMMVYNALYDQGTRIHETIQATLSAGRFNIETFMEQRTDFYKRSSRVRYFLRSILNQITFGNNTSFTKGDDLFNLFRDYAFYRGVVHTPYKYANSDDEQTLYVFSLLTQFVQRDEHIQNIYRLINTYNGFSYSVLDKKTRSSLFNPDVDADTKQVIITNEMMGRFITNIDTEIRSLTDRPKRELTARVENIVNAISMCQKIGDKSAFMEKFYVSLQRRLTDYSDIETDMIILDLLLASYSESPETYMNMRFCLADIEAQASVNDLYRSIDINNQTGKWDRVFDQFNRNRVTHQLLRRSAWPVLTESTELSEMNHAGPIRMYSDIFNDFYHLVLQKQLDIFSRRKIQLSAEHSTVEMDLAIGDRTFVIRGNMVQMNILYNIYDNDSLSAAKLSQLMNVPLQNINAELNSLIISKLVIRDPVIKNNDTSMNFSLNDRFDPDYDNVDLLAYLTKVRNMLNKKNPEKDQESPTPVQTINQPKSDETDEKVIKEVAETNEKNNEDDEEKVEEDEEIEEVDVDAEADVKGVMNSTNTDSNPVSSDLEKEVEVMAGNLNCEEDVEEDDEEDDEEIGSGSDHGADQVDNFESNLDSILDNDKFSDISEGKNETDEWHSDWETDSDEEIDHSAIQNAVAEDVSEESEDPVPVRRPAAAKKGARKIQVRRR